MFFSWLAAHPQYVELLGVGVLWINVHCAGMCGPLVVGLDLGGHLRPAGERAASRMDRWGAPALRLACYQAGRAVTYAVLGALAGAAGLALQRVFEPVANLAALLGAAALLAGGLGLTFARGRLPAWAAGGALGRWLTVLIRRLGLSPGSPAGRAFDQAPPGGGGRGYRQRFLLGLALGLLPCMITLYTLGLAASSGSPLHGALLMVLQVVMTSGVIFTFGLAPALASPQLHRWRQALIGPAVLLSGVWLGLVGAAANDWIRHLHLPLSVAGRSFQIMLW